MRTLEADFVELTAQAEELVAAETGLRSLAGPARARVTDQAGWVTANVASFRRLIEPMAEKLSSAMDPPSRLGPVPLQLPVAVSRRVAGAQVGVLLGWMSTRVLGQYDQLLTEEEDPSDQDMVYYVGPNILALERRYGFPPREFRLWIALHEVTHRAQFTGVPWMRDHFLSLVNATLGSVDPDPKRLLDALRRSADAIRAGRNPLDEGGLITLLATPEQFVAIQQIGGLMSLLEGHGDVTMDRAGAEAIPNAPTFSRVLRERRQRRGASRILTSLIGLDAKMRQSEQGEQFIASVERAGGRDLVARVWRGPEWLPSLPEIREPDRWISRAKGPTLALGS
jgi:coenzyme F420 biosynthesis associated uncharacterized protein